MQSGSSLPKAALGLYAGIWHYPKPQVCPQEHRFGEGRAPKKKKRHPSHPDSAKCSGPSSASLPRGGRSVAFASRRTQGARRTPSLWMHPRPILTVCIGEESESLCFQKGASSSVINSGPSGGSVTLHGFINKTLATPDEDLALARKRKKELEQ